MSQRFPRGFRWLEKERRAVKAALFRDAQTTFIVKQGEEEMPAADTCRTTGISQAADFDWKTIYALPSALQTSREIAKVVCGKVPVVPRLIFACL